MLSFHDEDRGFAFCGFVNFTIRTVTRPFVDMFCGLIVREPDTMPEVPTTKEGYLYTSKDEGFGDKACMNCQIDGDVYATYPTTLEMSARYAQTTANDGTQLPEENFSYLRVLRKDVARWDNLQWDVPVVDEGSEGVAVCPADFGLYAVKYRIVSIDWRRKRMTLWRSALKSTSSRTQLPEDFGYMYFTETNLEMLTTVRAAHTWTGTFNRLTRYDADNWYYALHYAAPSYDKGLLCQEAVRGTKMVDINLMMYVKELFEIDSLIKSTGGSFMQIVSNPLKESSNLYLSGHYGYRLSLKDTRELIGKALFSLDSISSKYFATRARQNVDFVPRLGPLGNNRITGYQACKVWYKQVDDGLLQALNTMFRWDVFPELGNVWDMIPYSFVVDWFLPLSNILDSIDYHTYASTLHVGRVYYSELLQTTISSSCPLLAGLFSGYHSVTPLRVKVYTRWGEPELSYPKIGLQLQAGPGNWLPAGALILQRIK